MSDLEQRAHDLAVSYTQYIGMVELLKKDSKQLIDSEKDYCSNYSFYYDAFKELLSRKEQQL